jgi:hypothetical protein
MPQRSTLLHVATLVIDQVLAEVDNNTDLCEALNAAYPFGDDPEGREVWLEALLRNAFDANLLKIQQQNDLSPCAEGGRLLLRSEGRTAVDDGRIASPCTGGHEELE